MTPIERAARALCDVYFEDPDEIVTTIGMNPGVPIPAWRQHVHDVRAVLTAIREPSESMKAAAETAPLATSHGGDNDTFDYRSDDGAEHVWRKMIDAVLKEG